MTIHPDQPAFLLDTGPLSILCGFSAQDDFFIDAVLNHCRIVLPDGVIAEAGRGRIWRVVNPLLRNNRIITMIAPGDPQILDDSYGEHLGLGERAAIKCALLSSLPLVIDDRDAFVVACRFGLRPIGFQDFIVRLVHEYGMSQDVGIRIVTETSRQHPKMFLLHTLTLLK